MTTALIEPVEIVIVNHVVAALKTIKSANGTFYTDPRRIYELYGNAIEIAAPGEQGAHAKMPDIDHFQLNLGEIRLLLLPPLVAVVLDQFATLDPGSPVPLKMLLDPVVVYPAIHSVLHVQHGQ